MAIRQTNPAPVLAPTGQLDVEIEIDQRRTRKLVIDHAERDAARWVSDFERPLRRKLAAEFLARACQLQCLARADPNLRAVFVGIAQTWLDRANRIYDPTDPDCLDRAAYQQVIRTKLGRALQAEFTTEKARAKMGRAYPKLSAKESKSL